MAQHVFIVMPFGEKEGINFNRVYADLVKPALQQVGLDPFRADEEILPGDIRADMFQELLMADLVVADLSIDNPNAWYELGIRHGLRAKGVVQIRCSQGKLPFDVCVDRTLHYHIKEGIPDQEFLEEDRKALAEVAVATLRPLPSRRTSPVYNYLPSLQEPDWKSLRVKCADSFWDAHDDWERRIEVAKKNNKPGDILVLAEEAPTYSLRLEGYRTAGLALRSLGQFAFALEQFDKALDIDPEDLQSAQQKSILLGRLNKTAQAEEVIRKLLKTHPQDAETWALLGRVEKDLWISLWRSKDKRVAEMREDAAFEEVQLSSAINAYRQGYIEQPGHYFSGINAVTLTYLLNHLVGSVSPSDELNAMVGGVRWAIISELTKETTDQTNYWARVSLADLELLVSDTQMVEQAYKHAVTAARNDWFALDSSLQQLKLLRDLEFRPPQVNAALHVLKRARDRITKPQDSWSPRHVFLFSGHMIDALDRDTPRFPAEAEPAAIKRIGELLKSLNAGPEDIAICGGACGGDLIFAEACLDLGLKLEVRIPFDTPEFLQNSVDFAGDDWRGRFFAVISHEQTSLHRMPDELGELPDLANPYERNNLWQLYSAISWGADKVHFLSIWNGEGGDGPGGTKHMHDAVKQRSGKVYVIDTNELFNGENGHEC